MEPKIHVRMIAHKDHAWTEGRNPVIFEKIYPVEIDPQFICALLTRYLPVLTNWTEVGNQSRLMGHFEFYDPTTNTFQVRLSMESWSQKYVDHLQNNGWTFFPDRLSVYTDISPLRDHPPYL